MIMCSRPNAGTASTKMPNTMIAIAITKSQPQAEAPYLLISRAKPIAENPLNNSQKPSTNGKIEAVMWGYARMKHPIKMSNMPLATVQPQVWRDRFAEKANKSSKTPTNNMHTPKRTLRDT